MQHYATLHDISTLKTSATFVTLRHEDHQKYFTKFILEHYRGESYANKVCRKYFGWDKENFKSEMLDIIPAILDLSDTKSFKKFLEKTGCNPSDFDEEAKEPLLSQAIKTDSPRKLQTMLSTVGLPKSRETQLALFKQALKKSDDMFDITANALGALNEEEILNMLSSFNIEIINSSKWHRVFTLLFDDPFSKDEIVTFPSSGYFDPPTNNAELQRIFRYLKIIENSELRYFLIKSTLLQKNDDLTKMLQLKFGVTKNELARATKNIQGEKAVAESFTYTFFLSAFIFPYLRLKATQKKLTNTQAFKALFRGVTPKTLCNEYQEALIATLKEFSKETACTASHNLMLKLFNSINSLHVKHINFIFPQARLPFPQTDCSCDLKSFSKFLKKKYIIENNQFLPAPKNQDYADSLYLLAKLLPGDKTDFEKNLIFKHEDRIAKKVLSGGSKSLTWLCATTLNKNPGFINDAGKAFLEKDSPVRDLLKMNKRVVL